MNKSAPYRIACLSAAVAWFSCTQAWSQTRERPGAESTKPKFGSHHRVWEGPSSSPKSNGQAAKRELIEVHTGMLYLENGAWRKAVEQIELREQHAVAYRGQHQVIFSPNANRIGAVYLIDSQGREFRSHVLGLSYYDATNRTSVLLAEVKDSVAELVAPNQLVYKDAFTDIRADIRFTYTKAGLEQDVILHQLPPAPETFGMHPDTTRLEVLTEFVTSPPPKVAGRKLREEKDAQRRSALAEPDLIDETVDFGGLVIGQGKAFFTRSMEQPPARPDPESGRGARAGPPPGRKSLPVAKRWEKLSGRQFLIEAVEYAAIRESVERLPEAKPTKRTASHHRVLPQPRDAQPGAHEKILAAQAPYRPTGLVVDYYLVHTTPDFTFESDETYYISGDVFLSGTTAIHRDAVLKFAPGASLRVLGELRSPRNGKAYLTAAHDHGLGLEVPSRGDPATEAAFLSLHNLPSGTAVQNLEIRYAAVGIEDYSPQAAHVIDGCMFFKCGTAVEVFGATIDLKNSEMREVQTPHRNVGGGAVVRPSNLTTRRQSRATPSARLMVNDDHGDSTGSATSIGASSSVSGAIDHSGDEDYFRISVGSSGTLNVYTTGDTDTYGYLLDGSGNTLTSNDDNPYPNFSFSYSVSSGTYYVRVRHYSSSGTGSYTLNTSFSGGGGSSGGDDHGNSPGSATSISIGGGAGGAIDYAGDEDYFQVYAGSSGTLIAYSTGSTDTYGYLLDAAGGTLTSNDDNPYPNFRFSYSISPGTYYIRVRHYSSGGTGSYSLYVELSGGPQPPPAPDGLGATAYHEVPHVYLSWFGSVEAASYNVKRAVNGGSFSVIGSTVGTGFFDFNTAHGTTYTYAVSAVNSVGESANSSSIGVSTAPVAPTGLSGYGGNGFVYLGWGATAGTYAYYVRRSTTSGGPYTDIATTSTTSFYDNSVSPGTTCYYVIVASSISGARSYPSAQFSATTVPAPPTGLSATPGSQQVSLVWSASAGASSYTVKRSMTSGGPYTAIAAGVAGASYVNSSLSDGTYYYVVSASNGSGESSNSAQASATVVASDSDGDGLPDTWEQQHFGTLSQNGTGDYDNDGLTNLQEYRAGTNPAVAAPCVTPLSGLVSWWRAEGNASDQAGSNHGTLRNGAAYGSGMAGPSFLLDGVDDVIEIPNSANLNFGSTSPISVETWVYRTGSGSIMHVLGKRDYCGSINYQLAFDPSGGLQFNSFSGGVLTGVQLIMNQWVHLAATFDGATFRLYADGVLIGSGGGTLGPMNGAPLMIGGSGTCSYTFAGKIDEVSLYNRALSASEIQSLYTAGRAGKCPPNPDSDGDGLLDAWELQHFGNLNQNGSGDSDADALTNAQEYQIGTNPALADTNGNGTTDGNEDFDADGLSNRNEFLVETNPLLADSDSDGVSDGDEDFDGDRLTNLLELTRYNSHPRSRYSLASQRTDAEVRMLGFVGDTTTDVYLSLVDSPSQVQLTIHRTAADQWYEIYTTEAFQAPPWDTLWKLETEVAGTSDQTTTSVSIPKNGRNNLFFVVGKAGDTDGDGLPDAYEVLAYSNLSPNLSDTGATGTLDGYKDPDQDGWTHLDEFRNGTHPNRFNTPAAPSNVRVNRPPGLTTATVRWDPSPGPVSEYIILQNGQEIGRTGSSGTGFIYTSPLGTWDIYQVQAAYPAGRSALTSEALMNQRDGVVAEGLVVRGPLGQFFLATTLVAPNVTTIRLHRQRGVPYGGWYPGFSYNPVWSSLGYESDSTLYGGNLPETFIDLPVNSTGLYAIPAPFAPDFEDYQFRIQGLLPDGTEGPLTSAGPWLGLQWLARPKIPFVDGRTHLAQNLSFQLRAANAVSPFQYEINANVQLTYHSSYGNSGYAVSDFYLRRLGQTYLNEFGPFQENQFYRNWVLGSGDLDGVNKLNTGVGFGNYRSRMPIFGEKYVFDVGNYVITRNSNLLQPILSDAQAQYIYHEDLLNIADPRIGVNRSSDLLQLASGFRNVFGLPYLSIKVASRYEPYDVGVMSAGITYADSSTFYGSTFQEVAPPVLETIGYYFTRANDYNGVNSAGIFPGDSAFTVNTTTPTLIAEVGKTFAIAGWAKQRIVNGDQTQFAYLGQYFDKAFKADGNGQATTQETGILSEYGEFFPAEPGRVIVRTKPDSAGRFGEVTVNVIKMELDVNHDGTIDRTLAGPDNTSTARPFRFWINNDRDGAFVPSETEGRSGEPDANDNEIKSLRDLEDFARLWISGVPGLAPSQYTVSLSWRNTTGTPRIRIFPAAETDGGNRYLTDQSAAQNQRLAAYNRFGLAVVSPSAEYILPSDLFLALGRKHFLFEGVSSGSGELVLTIRRLGQTIAQTSVFIQLSDIKEMYDRTVIQNVNDTVPNAFASSYSVDKLTRQDPGEAKQIIVFVHGWRMGQWDYHSFSESMFKRLYWQGYNGRFVALRWPTLSKDDYFLPMRDLLSYNKSEFRAFQSGRGLSDYFTYLRQRFPDYSINVAAHSMGNIVMMEVLKEQLAQGKRDINNYVLMQAASAAHCYNPELPNYDRFVQAEANIPTPDTYRGYGASINSAVRNQLVNFYNVLDYALATGTEPLVGEVNWERNAENKPEGPKYVTFGIHGYRKTLTGDQLVTDPRERMAFCARPRSMAVGAQAGVGGVISGGDVNLNAPPFSFDRQANEHSAQFNWNIQRLGSFYSTLLAELLR